MVVLDHMFIVDTVQRILMELTRLPIQALIIMCITTIHRIITPQPTLIIPVQQWLPSTGRGTIIQGSNTGDP